MKFITAIILSMLLGYLVYIFNASVPWWLVVFAGLVAGATVPQKPWQSLLSGFIGIALLWAVLVWYIDKENGSVLSARMAQVLPFNGNVQLLLATTALLGGIVGGLGALVGSYLRKKPD